MVLFSRKAVYWLWCFTHSIFCTSFRQLKSMASSLLFILIVGLVAIFLVEGKMAPRDKFPQIIAHRGASGYVPEHSLQAYQLAIDLKTDYIEPDLCLSKDGVFVALHDLLLDDVTNVASLPQYDSYKSTKVVDGKNTTGYFVSDFLYSELQDLRLNQRLPERTTLYNGLLQIPSFTSIMSLAQSQYSSSGILVGIYPELKHPSFFKSLGFPMEDMLLDALVGGGFDVYGDAVANDLQQVVPVVVQCFEADSLQYLHGKSTLPLILLLNPAPASFWTQENMAQVATYASGIGPAKDDFGSMPYETAVKNIDVVHSAGLRLHPWTFRADQDIGAAFHGSFSTELMYYYCCLGMDALFSEFPDRSRESLDTMGNYTQLVAANNIPVPAGQPVCNIQCSAY